MHFISGSPTVLALANLEKGDTVVHVAYSPQGTTFCVLTKLQLQFWSGLQHTVPLATIPLPRCSLLPGRDVGSTVCWHQSGKVVAVTTVDRRILLFEADILIADNSSAIAYRADHRDFRMANGASRIALGPEIQLDYGLIVSVVPTYHFLLVATSGGFLVPVLWASGAVKNVISLQALHLQVNLSAGSYTNNGGATAASSPTPSMDSPIITNAGVGAFAPVAAKGPLLGPGMGPEDQPSRSVMTFGDASASLHQLANSSLADAKVRGAISDLSYHTDSRLLAIAFSDGHAVVCQLEVVGANKQVTLRPICPPLRASNCDRIAINGTYRLIAIGANAESSVRLFTFTAGAMPKTKIETSGQALTEEPRDLRRITNMRWSQDEESLCISFGHHGLAIIARCGSCIMTTFSRFSGSGFGVRGVPALFPGDCPAVAWGCADTRIIACDTLNRTVMSFSVERAIPSANGFGGTKGHALLRGGAVAIYQPSDSEWASDTWEVVTAPRSYLATHYPLRYGAISACGEHICVAGARGLAIYTRRTRRWKAMPSPQQEMDIACTAAPHWINDAIVAVPVRRIAAQSYSVNLYARSALDNSTLLAQIPLKQKCTLLASSPRALGFENRIILAILDSTGQLLVAEVTVLADQLESPKVLTAALGQVRVVDLSPLRPTRMDLVPAPSYMRPAQAPLEGLNPVAHHGGSPPTGAHNPPQPRDKGIANGQALPTLVMISNHNLYILDLASTFAVARQIPSASGQSTVFNFWLDYSSCLSPCTMLTYGPDGLWTRPMLPSVETQHVAEPLTKGTGGGSPATPSGGPAFSPTCTILQGTLVSEHDPDSVPVAILPSEGYVLSASTSVDRRLLMAGAFPWYAPNVRPAVYQHLTLLSIFTELVRGGSEARGRRPDSLWALLHRLRAHGTLVETMDFLLFTAITQSGSAVGNSPALEQPIVDIRLLLEAITTTLRCFPEYFQVITGCVRKIDISDWRPIFDVIGSPADFFDKCVAKGHVREAAYIVRVILMGNDDPKEALEDTLRCSKRLFVIALEVGEIVLAYELLRFMVLLSMEIDLPPASPPEMPTTAIERAMRSLFWDTNAATTTMAPTPLHPPPSASPSSVARGLGRNDSKDGLLAQSQVNRDPSNASFPLAGNSSSMATALPHTDLLAPSATLIDEDGVARHGYASTLYTLLLKPSNTDLCSAAVKAATSYLVGGNVTGLFTLMDLFNLNLLHFIRAQWPSIQKEVKLAQVLAVLHSEFGLPAGAKEVDGLSTQLAIKRCPTLFERAGEPSPEEPFILVTATQEHIAAQPRTLGALRSLERLFESCGCWQYIAAIAILIPNPRGLSNAVRVANKSMSLKKAVTVTATGVPRDDIQAVLGGPAFAGYVRLKAAWEAENVDQ